ncbi:MAG: hypothetical protein J1E43_05790 [Christensenellaceae bacterium]|nr:hypothetical protein [Christensenellaceae bacterium]
MLIGDCQEKAGLFRRHFRLTKRLCRDTIKPADSSCGGASADDMIEREDDIHGIP